MRRLPISAAALAALSLMAAGCAKPARTTTTTTAAAAAPAPRALSVAVGPPHAAGAAALATGPGVIGDTSQTAALSAPANSNGTTPSRGVIEPPSR
jgi:hypothetical protein